MGKVVEKVKIINVFAPEKSVEVEALIDTGSTMVVLPKNIVDALGLKKIREAHVRYANNKMEPKGIFGPITLEIKGRAGTFDVIEEYEGTEPLIGQVVLETLDLIVDTNAGALMPNPLSPEIPLIRV